MTLPCSSTARIVSACGHGASWARISNAPFIAASTSGPPSSPTREPGSATPRRVAPSGHGSETNGGSSVRFGPVVSTATRADTIGDGMPYALSPRALTCHAAASGATAAPGSPGAVPAAAASGRGRTIEPGFAPAVLAGGIGMTPVREAPALGVAPRNPAVASPVGSSTYWGLGADQSAAEGIAGVSRAKTRSPAVPPSTSCGVSRPPPFGSTSMAAAGKLVK